MKSEFLHTLIAPVVQRGNLGKSTTIATIASWLEQHAFEWQGHDLDADHRNFARLYPDRVALSPKEELSENDIIQVLRRATKSPVTLIDPRAHLNYTIMRAMEMVRFAESFAASNGRIVALVFPSDDLEVMNDLDATVTRLGDKVQFVVVRNLARTNRTRMFTGSELELELQRLGAVNLEIPELLPAAKLIVAAKEAELDRGIPLLEAVANAELHLDPLIRVLIEGWVRCVFHQLDSISASLLPSRFAAAIAPVDTGAVASAPIRRGAKLNFKSI